MLRWNEVSQAALPMVLLCGCVAGPNFVPPKQGSPDRYTTSPLPQQPAPDASAGESSGETSAWWLALNSPRLDAT
ncbi:MAG TPA: hypothetical protein VGP20_07865, partial [Steroidobacteraceae bacterium]|nr:hypothetical protein [Steroidobacteraceae bacterium]